MTESGADIARYNLDEQGILSAVTALCGPDRPLSKKMGKLISRLLASTDWCGEVSRFEQKGINAKHFTGPLREALTLSGDLVLLRDAAGFRLLRFAEQRWQFLTAAGEPLPGQAELDDESVDAVILDLPLTEDRPGFSSLVALWPEFKARATW